LAHDVAREEKWGIVQNRLLYGKGYLTSSQLLSECIVTVCYILTMCEEVHDNGGQVDIFQFFMWKMTQAQQHIAGHKVEA
jgi:hypothetical protein